MHLWRWSEQQASTNAAGVMTLHQLTPAQGCSLSPGGVNGGLNSGNFYATLSMLFGNLEIVNFCDGTWYGRRCTKHKQVAHKSDKELINWAVSENCYSVVHQTLSKARHHPFPSTKTSKTGNWLGSKTIFNLQVNKRFLWHQFPYNGAENSTNFLVRCGHVCATLKSKGPSI